jgi:hypothetical protein
MRRVFAAKLTCGKSSAKLKQPSTRHSGVKRALWLKAMATRV